VESEVSVSVVPLEVSDWQQSSIDRSRGILHNVRVAQGASARCVQHAQELPELEPPGICYWCRIREILGFLKLVTLIAGIMSDSSAHRGGQIADADGRVRSG
jgi:hypothetical protein